ncbi:alpha/beta fold hydrolase [Lentisphaera profundi]|uniref:Alpha/beta fold hydrolase n=1 Tax=Lentisphaera profundi TaxID=1658616 RepID=A0ABY7W164_9BACT|nr:alpha/beta fold hydrolase [Lentisphaera profundi]WDE99299.1 alpha/beta fold hydrolase [Lentisphaera profundi]
MFEITEWQRSGDKATRALVILMHGYGADMHDLVSLSSAFGEGVVTYSLNAPGLLPSPEGTIMGRSWFNLISSPFGMEYDLEDVEDSAQAVKVFLEKIIPKENAPKVYLLGFSQGACLVHHLLLREAQMIDGGIALSGRYVDEVFDGDFDWSQLKGKDLFMSHGESDFVIPYESSEKIREFYKSHKMNFEFTSFPGAHDIPLKVFKAMKNWFNKVCK